VTKLKSAFAVSELAHCALSTHMTSW